MQDPLAAAGAVVVDCRPPLLPGAMDVSSIDLVEIESLTRASVADTVTPEGEQSIGGGDLLSLICPDVISQHRPQRLVVGVCVILTKNTHTRNKRRIY